MKFWLLENDVKTGPHESFEVRERIEAGELEESVLAWYQGAEAWMPLGEVAQFETLFLEKESELVTPPPTPEEAKMSHDKLKEAIARELAKAPPLHAIRRLFARFHDCLLYMSLVFLVFQEKAIAMLESESIFPLIGVGLAYVILDGIMTATWRTSPGKFLLGMRITDSIGHAIPLQFAVLRSLRAWILGLGMWVMWFLSLPISWFMARKFGYFLWDIPKRYRVVVRPFSGLHVVAYMASIFAMSFLLELALPKEVTEEWREKSGAQELMEKWNLPTQN